MKYLVKINTKCQTFKKHHYAHRKPYVTTKTLLFDDWWDRDYRNDTSSFREGNHFLIVPNEKIKVCDNNYVYHVEGNRYEVLDTSNTRCQCIKYKGTISAMTRTLRKD
jgi:hypothetical protein